MRIIVITPFEEPDAKLAIKFIQADAFVFLSAGHNPKIFEEEMDRVCSATSTTFGVFLPEGLNVDEINLKKYKTVISHILYASPKDFKKNSTHKTFVQVVSMEEAQEAIKLGAHGLILKGNESGGRTGDISSFIFMQKALNQFSIPYWIQGGMGPHTASAAVLTGAEGVIYDSQLALMGKYVDDSIVSKIILGLNGSETVIEKGYRYLKHGMLGSLEDMFSKNKISEITIDTYKNKTFLAGQDIVLAKIFRDTYKDAQTLIYLTKEIIKGNILNASRNNSIRENSEFAKKMGIRFPIVQGPMTRVSDVPDFIEAVAKSGVLPSLALSVMNKNQAEEALSKTAKKLKDLPWSVGLLGFLPPSIYNEQIQAVLASKPPFVIVAGGRADQFKFFKRNGIDAFIHSPSTRLFKQFTEEGVTHFIFEGRECGGHVGPLSSMTLWESLITEALNSPFVKKLHLLFAGGIHDSLSASIISTITSQLNEMGAKIGVLVGTAYLLTKEAVENKAITKKYQELIIKSNKTALVQTGPGHTTRCLETPYVDFLHKERKKMQKEKKSKEEIFIALETLNVGHLRIASKGIRRQGEKLITVDEKIQEKEGMYMIGEVASFMHKVTDMLSLNKNITTIHPLLCKKNKPIAVTHEAKRNCDIAVVGMSGIFPGADNIDQFWSNIIENRDMVTEVPVSRWSKELYYDPNSQGSKNEKTYTNKGGFIPNFLFDPTFFGIPPQTLSYIDPAQMCALKIAYDALADAGYIDKNFNRSKTSVIFGFEPGGDITGAYGLRIMLDQLFEKETSDFIKSKLPIFTEDSFSGVLGNIISGRISNRLDLGGQNFTIDAACASSLAALDAAVKELRYGESDLVISGGVDFHNGIHDYIMFCSTHALSRNGKCASFSDNADGIVLGEGCGALILKRHEDAVLDNDKIYAVIKGIGSASDGKSLGLTAPRKLGQKLTLNRVYAAGGVSPNKIKLVEAHGTGTVVGDRTELASMEEVYSWSGVKRKSVALGSVKSQIGHTKCAAGIASLIKCIMAVRYGIIPPTLNLDKPNAYYDRVKSKFYFLDKAKPWLEIDRKAAVSSFGFGGINYHTVIENSNSHLKISPKIWPAELFIFRDKSIELSIEKINKISAYLSTNSYNIFLADLSYSLHTLNNPKDPVQVSIVATSIDDLKEKMLIAKDKRESLKGVYIKQNQQAINKVAFMFPGQGSQFLNMGLDLFNYLPELRKLLKNLDSSYIDVWFPEISFSEENKKKQMERISHTRYCQPLIGTLSTAVAQLLSKLGIQASSVVGHSYGELVALSYAGSFTFKQLINVSQMRAEAIEAEEKEEPGSMLVVKSDQKWFDRLSSDFPGLDIANYNSPNQIVFSGPSELIKKASEQCKNANVSSKIINVSHAFHSRLIKGADIRFKKHLQTLSFKKPELEVWSNFSSEIYEYDKLIENLSNHLIYPVRYREIIRKMHQSGVNVFIEVGPGNTQSGFVKDTLSGEKVEVISTITQPQGNLFSVLNAVAKLSCLVDGVNIDYLFKNRELKMLDFSKNNEIPKTMWSVNGHYAKPLFGEIPKNGYNPEQSFSKDQLPKAGKTFNTTSDNREEVVKDYLKTLDHFINVQKDVMLSYLGANPIIPSEVKINDDREYIGNGESAKETLSNNGISKQNESPSVSLMKIDRKNLEKLLIASISERTGYPVEMLDLDLDLEADLGVDSIKRMELLSEVGNKLGISDQFMAIDQSGDEATEVLQQVASLKTIRGIIEWMLEFTDKNPNNHIIPVSVSKVEEDRKALATQPTEVSLESIQNILIENIVERTGYPKDMVDISLDLEADLGIDSIKRVELLSEIGKKLGILDDIEISDQMGEESVQLLEQIVELKSVEGIAKWIYNAMQKKSGLIGESSLKNEIGDPNVGTVKDSHESSDQKIHKYNIVFKKIALPKNAIKKQGQLKFVLIGGKSVEKSYIINQFSVQNITVKSAKNNAFSEETLKDINGIIYLSEGSKPGRGNLSDVMNLFKIAKKIVPSQIQFFLCLNLYETPYIKNEAYLGPMTGSGVSGFLASLQWEWPSVKILCITIHKSKSKIKWTDHIVNEIYAERPMSLMMETAFYNGERYMRVYEPESKVISSQPIKLDHSSIILAVGGAKGITNWGIVGLAKKYKCKVVVIGRSPLPRKFIDPYPELTSEIEIRKALLQKETNATPTKIEQEVKKLITTRTLIKNIEELKNNASSFSYYSCDVLNKNKLDKTITEIIKKYKRIDGCIYGAGIINDKFIKDKDEKTVEKIYKTKVTGLENVLDIIHKHHSPEFVILFSSLSASIGNRGQTDYAAANNTMDKMSIYYNQERETKYLSINWGPWKGAGMIDDSLNQYLKKMGIYGIDKQEGVNFLIQEIERIQKENPIIMVLKESENEEDKNFLSEMKLKLESFYLQETESL